MRHDLEAYEESVIRDSLHIAYIKHTDGCPTCRNADANPNNRARCVIGFNLLSLAKRFAPKVAV